MAAPGPDRPPVQADSSLAAPISEQNRERTSSNWNRVKPTSPVGSPPSPTNSLTLSAPSRPRIEVTASSSGKPTSSGTQSNGVQGSGSQLSSSTGAIIRTSAEDSSKRGSGDANSKISRESSRSQVAVQMLAVRVQYSLPSYPRGFVGFAHLFGPDWGAYWKTETAEMSMILLLIIVFQLSDAKQLPASAAACFVVSSFLVFLGFFPHNCLPMAAVGVFSLLNLICRRISRPPQSCSTFSPCWLQTILENGYVSKTLACELFLQIATDDSCLALLGFWSLPRDI